MKTKKTSIRMKACAIFVTAVFMFSLLPVDAGGQIESAVIDTSGAAGPAGITKEIKQFLPKQGNVTVNFKDVDIMTILHYLSEVSGVDIVPSPGVEGTVTMRLRDKPWEVALDIVTRNYGYVYSRDDEQGIIRVMPKERLMAEEPITEVIQLNHIMPEIELSKGATGTSSEDVGVEEEQQSISQLLIAIDSILDLERGEKATFITSANSIIVTAIPARIGEIKILVEKVDKKPPQIILDAKIINITLTKDERFGIDWNMIFSIAGAKRPITLPFTNEGILRFLPTRQEYWYPLGADGTASFPLVKQEAIDAPVEDGLFTFGTLDFSTFTATLSLLDQRGDTEVVSSPRITTLNNQKATIKVIDKIMLQKTQETTQTAGIVTVEFEDEAEAREVGVKLTVIPHVNNEGDISVNLLPEVSTDAGFTTQAVAGGTQSTVALTISSREANTTIRVRDGDTIFIGGLIKTDTEKHDNKVPLLGDLFGGIPVIGNVFRYESEETTRNEIAFFVTVNLVKESTDAVRAAGEMARYEQFYLSDKDGPGAEDKKEGYSGKEGGMAGKKTGKRKPSVVTVSEAVEGKKEYAPLLDFRKKEKKTKK